MIYLVKSTVMIFLGEESSDDISCEVSSDDISCEASSDDIACEGYE